jgi:hypothetical protein
MTTPEIRAEIEQILIDHARTRAAKVLIGMCNELTDADMAAASIEEGQPINAESVAAVRRLVRMTLDDQIVPAPSDAAAQAAIYRELLNYRRSDELTQHIRTKLAKLRAIDPTIPDTPLGHIVLGGPGGTPQGKPEEVCQQCFLVHSGECP